MEESEYLGERVYTCLVPPGLSLYLLPKPGFHTAHALLSVGYGSLDRSFRLLGSSPQTAPDGVAHFLEHRLFASPLGDVGDRFAALGAEVNAHTTYTNTSYFFTAATRVEECLEFLLDFVLNPQFTAEGVVRERAIITRELQLYGDSLEWISFIRALQALYGDHPLGVDIAGTPASVAAIDLDLLQRCYGAFYRPGNMRLFIGGRFEVEAVVERVGRCLEGCAEGPSPLLQRGTDGHQGPLRLSTALPVALPRLCLGFGELGAPAQGQALLRRELCAELVLDLLFGAASDFYARHYESGLIDAESFGCEVYFEPEFSFCLIGGDTPDPAGLEAEILGELERARETDTLEKGFARAARRAYGQAVQRLDQVEGAVGAVFGAVSRGAEPFGLFEAHRHLGPPELRAFLEDHLLPARRGAAVVMPGAL